MSYLTLKLKAEFLYCPKCKAKAKLDSIEKFLREHYKHFDTKYPFRYPKLVAYIRRPSELRKAKVSIQFVDDPKILCRYKFCRNYSKKADGFCDGTCREYYKANKKQRKKDKKRGGKK